MLLEISSSIPPPSHPRPSNLLLRLHIPSLINPFPTPCIPLAVLYTRQYVRLCAQPWQSLKSGLRRNVCMGKETEIRGYERKRERDGCWKFYNTSPSFSHTLSAHILRLTLTALYTYPLLFWKTIPSLSSFITSPCLAQARILIDFICAHVSETVAKTGGWGEKMKSLNIYRSRRGGGEKAKMQREERTNMFSLFCAYVIKTAIYMYLRFRRVWSLTLRRISLLFISPPPPI